MAAAGLQTRSVSLGRGLAQWAHHTEENYSAIKKIRGHDMVNIQGQNPMRVTGRAARWLENTRAVHAQTHLYRGLQKESDKKQENQQFLEEKGSEHGRKLTS